MAEDGEAERLRAIERHLKGESVSAICASLQRSRVWFHRWLDRFKSGDPEWFRERSRRPRRNPSRTSSEVENAVRRLRSRLEEQGEFSGAQAIRWEMEELGLEPLPSIRTIGRILARENLTRRRNGGYVSKGKKYPKLIGITPGEAHQTDFIGPCYLRGGVRFYGLNSVDLATGRCATEPTQGQDAQATLDAFWNSWMRGIEVWFIPMGEPWRNGVVEKFNDFWQQKFLGRVEMTSEADLVPQSRRFEERHNSRYRYGKLGGRTPMGALDASGGKLRFPTSNAVPRHPLPRPENGHYHLVRFVRGDAEIDVFGEKFAAPPECVHEYVRLTVDVARERLQVFLDHRLVDEHDYAQGSR
jgi:putative transposase